MALTLIDSANASGNGAQAGVIESVYNLNPLLSLLPFVSTNGSGTFSYNLVGDSAGSTSRQVNSDFVEGTPSFSERVFKLGILGGKGYDDNYIQVTTEPVDMLAAVAAAKAKAVGERFQYEFFNGDTSAAGGVNTFGETVAFDGLRKLALGEDVTSDNLDLDDIDAAIDGVNGQSTVILANGKTASRINKLARGLVQVDNIEMVGARLSTYGGIPVIRTGKYKGTDVLADGEIWAVKLGEDGVFGVQKSLPTPVPYGPNSERPGWTVRIDWYVGLAARIGSAYRVKRTLA